MRMRPQFGSQTVMQVQLMVEVQVLLSAVDLHQLESFQTGCTLPLDAISPADLPLDAISLEQMHWKDLEASA